MFRRGKFGLKNKYDQEREWCGHLGPHLACTFFQVKTASECVLASGAILRARAINPEDRKSAGGPAQVQAPLLFPLWQP
jgi:hypothetical protein